MKLTNKQATAISGIGILGMGMLAVSAMGTTGLIAVKTGLNSSTVIAKSVPMMAAASGVTLGGIVAVIRMGSEKNERRQN